MNNIELNDDNLVLKSSFDVGFTSSPSTIIFQIDKNETPILLLEGNGDIYVKGRLIVNDIEVVDSLREFLKSANNLK